jgi:hypothetical protein
VAVAQITVPPGLPAPPHAVRCGRDVPVLAEPLPEGGWRLVAGQALVAQARLRRGQAPLAVLPVAAAPRLGAAVRLPASGLGGVALGRALAHAREELVALGLGNVRAGALAALLEWPVRAVGGATQGRSSGGRRGGRELHSAVLPGGAVQVRALGEQVVVDASVSLPGWTIDQAAGLSGRVLASEVLAAWMRALRVAAAEVAAGG